MKSLLFFMMLLLSVSYSYAHVNSDTTKVKTTFSGFIQVTNNGISLVPAFSLGDPALMAFFEAKRKRFSYCPQFSFDSEGKPWFSNQWLRFQVVDKPNFSYRSSISYSFLYKPSEEVNDGLVTPIIKIDRNVLFEQLFVKAVTAKTVVILAHLHGMPTVKNGINLDLVTLGTNTKGIKLAKKIAMDVAPSIFYLTYTGDNEGLFTTENINFKHEKFPITLGFQATEPLWMKNLKVKHFNWAVSLLYAF